ncbi:MAG: cytochrome P450 [Acidimicrobiia bacterium]|nr:cytochrome P450 [Acidimicrobiia bacterium]
MTTTVGSATTPAWIPRGGEAWRDPFDDYRALRDEDPIHHAVVDGGDFWVLSRFQNVFDAARDTTTFSSAHGLTHKPGDDPETLGLAAPPIVMLDPPDHTEFRRLVTKGFRPRAVAELEPEVRAFVVERIERIRQTGTADIVAELFKPLPSLVVAHFLGVPPEDRYLFDGWTENIVAANARGNALDAAEASTNLFDYFGRLLERRRVEPGDDTVSDLVHAGLDDDTEVMRILGFAFTMVTGGNDTTTGLLGGAAQLLTEFPDQRRILLNHPALLPEAIEELLRLTSPVQNLARTTTRPVTLHDVEIPQGRKVMLLYAAANRDDREFGPDAEAFRARRKIAKHLAFSYGAHHCLGAPAARLAARVALEELLARCPNFTVDAAAGRFAPGEFVRRYESLPFSADSFM